MRQRGKRRNEKTVSDHWVSNAGEGKKYSCSCGIELLISLNRMCMWAFDSRYNREIVFVETIMTVSIFRFDVLAFRSVHLLPEIFTKLTRINFIRSKWTFQRFEPFASRWQHHHYLPIYFTEFFLQIWILLNWNESPLHIGSFVTLNLHSNFIHVWMHRNAKSDNIFLVKLNKLEMKTQAIVGGMKYADFAVRLMPSRNASRN